MQWHPANLIGAFASRSELQQTLLCMSSCQVCTSLCADRTLRVSVRSLQGAAVDSRRRTAAEFQRYATLSAATHRLLEPDLSEQRRQEVPLV